MIHDAEIPVTCDAKNCNDEVFIKPRYRYMSQLASNSGYYDTKDSSLTPLIEEEDWIVDGDKHYCCEHCATSEKLLTAT